MGGVVILIVCLLGIGGIALAGGVGGFGSDGSPTADGGTPTPEPTTTAAPTPTATATQEPTATPTQTETAEATQTATPTATETDTPTATPTDTPTVTPTETPTETPDGSAEDAVTLSFHYRNTSTPLESGDVTLFDGDGYTINRDFDFSENNTFVLENLNPDETYRLELTGFRNHGELFPEETAEFTPRVDDEVNVTAGVDFQGSESYRFWLRTVYSEDMDDDDEPKRHHARGKYDDGDNYHEWRAYHDWAHDQISRKYLEIDGERYYKGFTEEFNAWSKIDYLRENPGKRPEFFPAQKGLDAYNRDRITFTGTETLDDSNVWSVLKTDTVDYGYKNHTSLPEAINGTEVYAYRLGFNGTIEQLGYDYNFSSSNVTVYVHPETGYILRFMSSERFYGENEKESRLVIDFYSHETDSAEIEPADFDLPTAV